MPIPGSPPMRIIDPGTIPPPRTKSNSASPVRQRCASEPETSRRRGVGATLRCERVGLADNWLHHVQDVREKHAACLCALPDESARSARLRELNVVEQVLHVCQTTMVLDAWDRGQQLAIHGWIYGLQDGLLRNLNCSASSAKEAAENYASAIAALS